MGNGKREILFRRVGERLHFEEVEERKKKEKGRNGDDDHLDDESGKGWGSDEGEAGKESFFELYRCCCCIQATNPLKCKCVGFSIIIFPTQVTAYLS